MHKRTLLLILCCCFFLTTKGEPLKGFVITLDGKYIAGTIEQVNNFASTSAVVFINDFGTAYSYHPALIQGFVYIRDGKQFSYESHLYQGKWIFLQLLYVGSEISLFKYPEIQVDWIVRGHQISTQTANQKIFWLKQNKRAPFLLKRRHFRNKFSKLISEKAPDLAKKIGKRGYRYNNLGQILKEYDEVITSGIKKT